MTNYTKSYIYKIASKDPSINDIYIGSTCNFVKRRYQHKTVSNNPNNRHYNQYVYQFIRAHGGWGNWDIYMIEQFSCTSKIQKEQVERGYVEQLMPSLNKRIPANYQTGNVFSKSEYSKGYNKEIIYCEHCDHMINLHNRSHHNKTKKHITNSSESSEEEQYTIMDDMTKMRDDSELKLQEIQNTCYEIDKLISII